MQLLLLAHILSCDGEISFYGAQICVNLFIDTQPPDCKLVRMIIVHTLRTHFFNVCLILSYHLHSGHSNNIFFSDSQSKIIMKKNF